TFGEYASTVWDNHPTSSDSAFALRRLRTTTTRTTVSTNTPTAMSPPVFNAPSSFFAASPRAAPIEMCTNDQQAAPAAAAGRNLRYGRPAVPEAAGIRVRTTGRKRAKNTA